MNTNKGNFLYRMEQKFGRYAIPDLTIYLIGLYVVGWILNLVTAGASGALLCLDMDKVIMHGEIWRLFTFLLIPPDTSILFIITMIFYASIGRNLEQAWGTFYYNVYLFSGIIFVILGDLFMYLILWGVTGQSVSSIATNYYILMSMFLAFAYLYPDIQILFMFVIPIKVKWMAYFYYALMAYEIYKDLFRIRLGYSYYWGDIVSIVVSLMNFFIFYFLTKKKTRVSHKQKKRQRDYKTKMIRANQSKSTRHRCAVCGATEEDHPELEFRFCSKCNGNYEYCQNHLFTHKHVK